MSSTEMFFFLFTSPPRYLSSFSMNSSQACFFHSPLRTISLSRPSYGFFSKRDPSLCYQPFRSKSCLTTSLSLSRTRETSFTQMNGKHLFTKERKSFSISYSDKHRDESTGSDEMHTDALDVETIPLESQSSQNSGVSKYTSGKQAKVFFRKRFLDFVPDKFKSEIRRRLFL